MSRKKVLLIDSFGLLFRSYFALEKTGLSTRDGRQTFAIYGFFRAFFKALQEINPTDIVFALESKTSLRKELDPNYKANRKEQPQSLLDQIGLFHELLEETGLPSVRLEGYEADDVLSTLTAFYKEQKNTEIYIYTSDKDLAQLVSERVFLVQPAKTVAQPLELLDEKGVIDKFGVKPYQMMDYLAIVGDASDNVRGVDGVGIKTASKLLQEYGTLEGIFEHIEELSKGVQEKFQKSTEVLKLGRSLVALHQDYSFLQDPHIGELKKAQIDKLKKSFLDLEFSPFKELPLLYRIVKDVDSESFELFSLEGQVDDQAVSYSFEMIDSSGAHYKMITTVKEMLDIKNQIQQMGFVCFDTETTGLDIQEDILLGISLCWKEKQAFYIPLGHKRLEQQVPLKDFQEIFSEIFHSSQIKKIGHNVKYDYKVLKKVFPNICGMEFDTMIAAYLLKPDSKRYNLDDLSIEVCGYKKIAYKDLVDGREHYTLMSVDIDKVKDYACEDADLTYRLYLKLKEEIERQNLQSIFYSVEMPLVEILANMELEGIGVDINYFENLQGVFKQKLEALSQSIFSIAGEEINLNSPKQVSGLLYEKMKLPKPRSAGRSKSVFATDEESLQKLGEFAIVKNILEYRKYNKLLTTYAIPLVNKAYKNPLEKLPRIHTSFQQTGTATGRLSSTEPNLQNIPIRDEAGILIRKGFVARPDYVFISLDYSQIELRLMAHFSSDPYLIQAFQSDEDIHIATASQIFGKSTQEINPRERDIAKTINFGIIYGMGYMKLARDLSISNQEAKEFIQKYFELFKGVKDFIDDTKIQAHQQAYVSTILGRKRLLPEINSTNPMIIGMNERMAVNTVIQGSNADLMKKAMIDIARQEDLESARMILQIHDELVFEVLATQAEKVGKKLRDFMENVYILKVPLRASLNIGSDWGSLKS